MAEPKRTRTSEKGDLNGARVLIVEARFYDAIQDAMLEGARAVLKAAGVTHDVVTVPGALEIPATIAMMLNSDADEDQPFEGAIALGCVIRGDTIHFEIVSQESSRGLMNLSVERAFPIGNGILTVNDEQQAWVRARASELDKGGDAARACLAMIRMNRRFPPAELPDMMKSLLDG